MGNTVVKNFAIYQKVIINKNEPKHSEENQEKMKEEIPKLNEKFEILDERVCRNSQ